MTRKDYIALAEALRNSRPFIAQRSTREQRSCLAVWEDTRGKIMEVLRANNPNFNRARFVEATEE